MKKYIFIIILASFTLKLQAQASFSLNKDTKFVNIYDEPVSFEDFIKYTNTYTYSITPAFKENGELYKVELDLKGNNHVFHNKIIEPKPESSNSSFRERHQIFDTESYYTTVKELEGQKAPLFKAYDINNRPISLSNYKDNVVVLNFWFSKCAPCIEEIPDLNNLKKSLNGKKVVFLALTVENLRYTNDFLKENDFDFNIVPEAHRIAGQYKTVGYPTSVIINKEGIVQKVFSGKITNTEEVFNAEITKALLKRAEDESVELLSAGESLFFADEEVYSESGTILGEDEFYEALLNYNCNIYKHIRNNKTIYYTILKLNKK